MEISLKGYGNKYVTMRVENATIGDCLDISKNNTATKAQELKAPIGKLISLNGAYGLVQTSGAVELRYDSIPPKLGLGFLVADAKGGAKEGADGRQAIITEVDTVNKTFVALM